MNRYDRTTITAIYIKLKLIISIIKVRYIKFTNLTITLKIQLNSIIQSLIIIFKLNPFLRIITIYQRIIIIPTKLYAQTIILIAIIHK